MMEMGLPSNAVEYSTCPTVPSASIQSLLMSRRPSPASITFIVYFFMGGLGLNFDLEILRSQSPNSASIFPARAVLDHAVRPRVATAIDVAVHVGTRTILPPRWDRRMVSLQSAIADSQAACPMWRRQHNGANARIMNGARTTNRVLEDGPAQGQG